jgi:uncharacterized protein (DUF305 family)
MRKNFVIGGIVLAAALLLGACGGAEPASGTDHNADDVTFARQMIPHHSQALDMDP